MDDRQRVSDDAAVQRFDLCGFDCELVGGKLRAVPREDYPDADSARAVLEPGLRGWEASSELIDGLPVRWQFSGSMIQAVDSAGSTFAMAEVADSVGLVDEASVLRDAYPLPDPAIGIEGPVTALLRPRWRAMQQGREPLPSCAYFVASTVRSSFGGTRQAVAAWLGKAKGVLVAIEERSSREHPGLGRKADPTNPRVLTSADIDWLRAVLPVLIRRVMEHEAGVPHLPQITMADLPPLP